MKLSSYLRTSLAAGALLLAGSLALAQTASVKQSPGQHAQPGQTPGMAVNEQGSRGHNGIPSMAVNHAGGNGVRRADTPTGGTNPLYEGKDSMVKSQPSSVNTAATKSAASGKRRKHIAGVKYEDRMSRGNNTPGMAVNEQGSRGPAHIYRRH